MSDTEHNEQPAEDAPQENIEDNISEEGDDAAFEPLDMNNLPPELANLLQQLQQNPVGNQYFFRGDDEIEEDRFKKTDYTKLSTATFVEPTLAVRYKVNTRHQHHQLLNLCELNGDESGLYVYSYDKGLDEQAYRASLESGTEFHDTDPPGEDDHWSAPPLKKFDFQTQKLFKVPAITVPGIYCIASKYGYVAVNNSGVVQVLHEASGKLVEGLKIFVGKLNDVWNYDPSTNIWTFIAGTNKKDQFGISIGGIGEYNVDNTPGGLIDGCSWISNGRLYLFGGERTDQSFSSAVWKFDPSTSMWAFMQSSESVTGSYVPEYQIGARKLCQCVLDIDNLYVSGGYGYDSTARGFLNDVWTYTVSSNKWTYVGGENTHDCPGTLNTFDVPSTTEFPTCSAQIAGWKSGQELYFTAGRSSFRPISNVFSFLGANPAVFTLLNSTGDLTPRFDSGSVSDGWIFGGFGQSAATGNTGYLADLLQWDGTAWKYVVGSRTEDTGGVYPNQPGTSTSTSAPGARANPAMWLDGNGDVWMFGGYGHVTSGDYGTLNDLWKYSPSSGQWTWVGGSQTVFQNGNYTADPIVPPVAPPVAEPVAESPVSTPKDSPVGAPTSQVSAPIAQVANVTTPTDSGLSEGGTIAVAVVVSAVGAGAGLLLLLLLLKRRKKQKAKKAKATDLANINPTSHYSNTPNPNQSNGSSDTGAYQALNGLANTLSETTGTTAVAMTSTDNRLIPYSAVTLEKEIGVGSFGKVYLGKLRTTKVAIKVANAHIPQDEFIREANFQLAIPPHPNIVQLLGVSVDGPQPLVVLEYCNEGSLDKVLFESNKLSTPAEQIALAEAIASGVDHLHQNNIVHRDLAVRNILLSRGTPKISDFGMSRKLKEISQVGKTATNIGPLRWMSPESLGKQLYSTKSDVWSFGMILYEIVAHEEPHEHDDLISVAIKVRDEGFTPVIPETCPPLLREIMLMCWKMDPSDRPDMSTICSMLEGKA